LPLNHLLFADDLVIFTTVTFSEAIIIKGCLNKYSFWSGQTINASKSNILFSKNTAVSIISAIRNFLPYQTTPATAKHLGLPILYGNSKKAVFSDILDKVNGKIEGWRSKTLSQAGKTTLIKTMVSALPSYAMSSFLFPDGLCKQLDRAFKIFWWGFPKDKTRNLSLKSWNSLCLPNDQGGLGFRLMKEVNLSLISKLGWKMLSNHNSLWVSLFQQKCMVISYPLLFLLVPGFGMASRLLFLSYLLELVLFLIITQAFLYGPHHGFQHPLLLHLSQDWLLSPLITS
jgi:hypothetical protein